jgi:hypothetical protein
MPAGLALVMGLAEISPEKEQARNPAQDKRHKRPQRPQWGESLMKERLVERELTAPGDRVSKRVVTAGYSASMPGDNHDNMKPGGKWCSRSQLVC